MYKSNLKIYFLFGAVALLLSCNSTKRASAVKTSTTISALHFLGEKDVPHNLLFNNTTVGGLSSIDYNAATNTYYMICDDRSAINPARFYTAEILVTSTGIDSILFTGVYSLLQPNGHVYPNSKQDPYHTPDPEAMRYNPITKQLTWSSEGERIVTKKDTVLEDPSVIMITADGKYVDSFVMPPNLTMHATEKGPRQNGVLEGLTFADNYTTLFVNVEEPLYEDGPRVDIKDKGTYIRLLKFDIATKKNTAQYAYKPDNVAHAAVPENGYKINGVPDILSVGNNQLLVIERSYSTGRMACTIKVFAADLNTATNITNIPLAGETGKFAPAIKKLILNMDDLGIYIDNIEGVTFGPNLPNGHKTLLFVTDNNFNEKEIMQILLFEVMP